MNKFFAAIFVILCTLAGGYFITTVPYSMGEANAQVAVVPPAEGSGSALGAPTPVLAGSGVAVAPTATPALADPVEDPMGFFGDLSKAKKKGWLGLVLVLAYAVFRVLGRYAKPGSFLERLGEGNLAMVLAAGTTMVSGMVDAFFLGGSLATVMVAGLFALVGMLGTKKKG